MVKGGTGQQIGRELKIPMSPSSASADKPAPELPLPAYGKTGTTNDYRNGAFLGFIAAPNGQGKGFDAASGYAIGVYTGFDDNVSMLRRGFKGTGSAVAIPAWIPIARSVAEVDAFSDRIDLLDLEIQATGEPPLFNQDKYQKYVVSKRTGLPLPTADPRVLQGQGTYTEDLSDELSGGDGGEGAADAAAYTTIQIREE